MYVNIHTYDEFCYRSGFDNESKQLINHSPAVQKFRRGMCYRYGYTWLVERFGCVTDLGHMAGVELR